MVGRPHHSLGMNDPDRTTAPRSTARLAFREMTPADAPLLERLIGDPEVMWVYPAPYDADGIRRWIDWNHRLYRERGFGLWLLHGRDTGEFVGECGLTPQDVEGTEEIEVGYHVLKSLWGQGFATEAVTACRDQARDVLRLPRVVALIDPRNTASQRVATRAGLVHERDATFPTKVLRVYAIDFTPRSGPGTAAG
jgi:RimJ/RimL family protein N-acetyltransferase